MFVFYNAVLVLLSPFFVLSKLVSWLRRGPSKNYDLLRWSGGPYFCEPKPKGSVRLVYMCASFGEAVLAESVHGRLESDGFAVDAVFTIRNRQELERFRLNTGRQALLYPFDFWIPFSIWHRRAQPDIIVFVEKFFFGNAVLGSKAKGCRIVAINARANVRRKPIRKLLSFCYPALVRSFDWIGARTEEHAKRIREIDPQGARVENVGNVKSGMPIKPISESQMESLRAWALSANHPSTLFVAGSLNDDVEIDFVLDAFQRLRQSIEASILIAPRHLVNVSMVQAKAEGMGYRCSLRTATEPEADVLVLDTMGELAHAYQFGVGSFIGGTISGMGHNLIESLQWGVPVAYGPVRGHFEDLQVLCEQNGIGFRLTSPAELARHWIELAGDESLQDALRTKIKQFLENERQGFERTVRTLETIVAELVSQQEKETKTEAERAVAGPVK